MNRQKELNVILAETQYILDFFTTILGDSQQVTVPVKVWIDETDQSFQELVCYINTPDGRTSAIWRTMQKHTTLHAGLNTLVSIQNVANANIFQKIMTALTTVLTGMFKQYTQYIGATGSIVQGWTQSWRLCETKWEQPDLENPKEQEPEEDDEDDWLPRYQIYTKVGTDISALRGLEHALGGGGSELATADEDSTMIMAYVVDLNLMQATLPLTMPFINWTMRFVWDGENGDTDQASNIWPSDTSFSRDADASDADLGTSANGTYATNDASKRQEPWSEFDYPDPVGRSKQKLNTQLSPDHFLKSLSQQKGQDLNKINYHTYASGRGEDAWIFVIDFGFSLEHAVREIQFSDLPISSLEETDPHHFNP